MWFWVWSQDYSVSMTQMFEPNLIKFLEPISRLQERERNKEKKKRTSLGTPEGRSNHQRQCFVCNLSEKPENPSGFEGRLSRGCFPQLLLKAVFVHKDNMLTLLV